jgi:hypothetical protein
MSNAAGGARVPLDDVMMSMDVVDTLRHQEHLVERELNDEARRAQLIARLRDIYRGQGIEVPDHILEAGVKALEERRFVYEPPRAGLMIWLARAYVARWALSRWIGGVSLALALALFAWNALVVWPRAEREAAARIELSETLPKQLNAAYSAIQSEAQTAAAAERAKSLLEDGLAAASEGKPQAARESLASLNALLEELRLVYDIRVVSRTGEMTGIWRIPKVNPGTRNYYLIVEAVDPNGAPLARPIFNEETGKQETVKTWAVRVSKDIFDSVRADKQDDGIIQKAVIGVKRRGALEPEWRITPPAGAITQW